VTAGVGGEPLMRRIALRQLHIQRRRGLIRRVQALPLRTVRPKVTRATVAAQFRIRADAKILIGGRCARVWRRGTSL